MPSFFRRLISDRAYTVKAASALLALTALLSNGLGLLRNLIFYRLIDPALLDVYYASFRIPDLLFNLLIIGAVSSAFVPIATELISQKKNEEAWKVTNQLLSWLTVVFVIIGIVLALAMEPVMRAVVPGFDSARFEDTVFISRILLLQPVLFAWSFTIGGLLNSTRRFTAYAIAPLLYNLSIIGGGLLAPQYGIRVIGYMVVFGALLHVLIQYSEAARLGFRPSFDLRLSDKIKEIFRLMIPRSLSSGMTQVVLVVFTTLASTLQAGSIAIYSGIYDLNTMPVLIIANSLGVAFFPALAAFISEERWDDMNKLLTKVTRAALFLIIPTIALAFVLRAQIVRLYFGIGGAGWGLTELAIDTFIWFLVGIIPAALIVLYARVFYSFKDTKTPMYISIIAGIISIIAAYLSIRVFNGSVAHLAMCSSILFFVQCVLYIYMLYRHDQVRLNLGQLFSRISSYIIGSGFMALAVWGTLHLIDWIYRTTDILGTRIIFGLLIQMLLAAAVGIAVYLGYSKLVHREELQWLKRKGFTSNQ